MWVMMKGYYQRKIKGLERALEIRNRELQKERAASREAERYIYALLRLLGGRAVVRIRDLGKQTGKVICDVHQGAGKIWMRIDYFRENREE